MTTRAEAVNEYITFTERGKRSSKTYKASIGIVSAQGSSKAEALSKLLQQIERAMDACYSPSFATQAGLHAIVYRTPSASLLLFSTGRWKDIALERNWALSEP
jgi:hypothetical protein